MARRVKGLGPVGKKNKPSATPLYVQCKHCGGTSENVYGLEETSGPCISCSNGYRQTGFTQERFDALVKDNDKLLLFLVDLEKVLDHGSVGPGLRILRELLHRRKLDVETAESRTKRGWE